MAAKQEKLEAIETHLAKIKQQALGVQEVAEEEFGITPTIEEVPEMPQNQATPLAVDTAIINAQTGAVALTTQIDGQQQLITSINKQAEEIAKTQKSWTDFMKSQQKKQEAQQVSIADERKRLMEEFGIPERFEELQAIQVETVALQGQLQKIDAQMDLEFAQVDQRMLGFPGGIIRGEKAIIRRQRLAERAMVAADLNMKLSQAQLAQGNLMMARSFVNDAITAVMFDVQQKRQDFEFMYNMNRDWYNDLRQDQKDLMDRSFALIVREEERQRTEHDEVGKLMLQAVGAGVRIGDTLDEAREKVAEWQRTQPKVFEAPRTMTTAQGIMQWDPVQGRRVSTGLQPFRAPAVGAKIDISDIQKGIPPEFAGLPEGQVIQMLASPTPPQWFVEQEFPRQTPRPQALQGAWDSYRTPILEKIQTPQTLLGLLGFMGTGKDGDINIADIGAQIMCEEGGGTWNTIDKTCER